MSEPITTPTPPAATGDLLTSPPSGTTPPASGNTIPPASSAPKSWRDDLPEDIRGEGSLKHITDVQTLAKSYINAQKMVGADKIPVPGKHATEQDWQQVYRKLGLPEKVEDYTLPEIKDGDKTVIEGFKKVAFENGILPKQAEKLLGFYQDLNKQALTANEAAKSAKMTEGVEALKKEWGNGFDKEVNAAKKALETFGDPDAIKYIRENGLGNDPVLVKIFNKIGKTLGEDTIKGDNGSRPGWGMTPAEADAKINSILSNAGHPYYNESHPNHAAAVKEVTELFAQKTSA